MIESIKGYRQIKEWLKKESYKEEYIDEILTRIARQVEEKQKLSELTPGKTYVDTSSGIRFLFIEAQTKKYYETIGGVEEVVTGDLIRRGLYYNPVTGSQQEIELFEYNIYMEVE